MDTTVTAPPAAPAAEQPAAAKRSVNLSVREHARRSENRRKQAEAATSANGSSAAPSAPANQITAPAAAQNSQANGQAHGEEAPTSEATNAEAPPILAGAQAPDPASATSPNGTAAAPDTQPANPDATPDAGDPTAQDDGGEIDAASVLESLESGELAPDARTQDRWLQQLDELFQGNDVPKVIQQLKSRLHSLADQRDTERNARLDAERRLAEQGNAERETRPAQPVADHPVLARIDAELNGTLQNIDLLDAHLAAVAKAERAGEEVPTHVRLPNGQVWSNANGPIEVTPEQARKWSRQYELQLSQLNSRRETTVAELQREHRTATTRSMESAVVAYPWLRNTKSAEYQELQTLLRQNPGLKSRPDWPEVAGDYIAGKMARLAAMGKTKLPAKAPPMTRPKGGTTPPPVGTAPAAAAAANAPQNGKATLQKQVQEARERYHKTGSVKDRANLSALERQLRTAA